MEILYKGDLEARETNSYAQASLLFPKDDENTCFLRVNDIDIRLSILFELCLVVQVPATEQSDAGMLKRFK